MENNQITLLYADEHKNCPNYVRESNIGFCNRELEKESTYDLKLESEFAVIFSRVGRVIIGTANQQRIALGKNEMCLLSNYSEYAMSAKSRSELTIMYFERLNSQCDLMVLGGMLDRINSKDVNRIRKLRMNGAIVEFIRSMTFFLGNEMYCSHLYDLKKSEFLFLVRAFYPKEEIAYFFTPVIRALNEFTNLVRANYQEVETVAELAEKLNMTTKTFTRKFKTAFDNTPKQWMLLEKSKLDSQHHKANGKNRQNCPPTTNGANGNFATSGANGTNGNGATRNLTTNGANGKNGTNGNGATKNGANGNGASLATNGKNGNNRRSSDVLR